MGLNLISYLMGGHYQLRRKRRFQGKSKLTLSPLYSWGRNPTPPSWGGKRRGDTDADGRSRAENLARAQALEGQVRLRDARDLYTKCVDITPEMALQLIKVRPLLFSIL